MSADFTLNKYTELLQRFIDQDYRFLTFEAYCLQKDSLGDGAFTILRHDVDLKAKNSLATAKIEHALGIKASYYFRVIEQSNKPEIISAIADMGHEIGYHYEDMAICEGDSEKAINHFKSQLNYFQQFYPVRTICMHGAPRSKYDGRDLWKRYDYHDFGIIGEPYFDADFSKIFYITDTGRRWDGFNVSVRDKVPGYQDEWVRQGLVYHTTNDVLSALAEGVFPKQLMMTTHPQRWTNSKGAWIREWAGQSVKNVVKRLIVHRS